MTAGPASAEFFRTRTPSKPGHAGLVEELARHHYIDARPAEALRQVDRQLFVPQGTPEEHVYLVRVNDCWLFQGKYSLAVKLCS